MNKKQLRNSILALTFCVGAWMAPGTDVWAANEIYIDANQSKTMDFNDGISRIAIANPAIADVTVMSGSQVLVVAKSVGSTTLYVWDAGGNQYTYNVVITNQDVATGGAIQHIIGYPGVRVDKIGGKILLTGKVKDQLEQQRAENIAKMYSDNVVDMISMSDPMQIRIEAKIVEISGNKSKDLGITWGNASDIDDTTGVVTVNSGTFSFGQDAVNSRWNSPLGGLGNIASINARLKLAIGKGDAKVLSQPHVVTMSGQKANILIGGEMPVSSTNANGSTNIEWKKYGIELNMEPTANEDGLILSKVKVSVSTLSEAASSTIGGNVLKGLEERSAETVITLGSGQTMAIGGLLSSEDVKSMTKIPLLGDIPILGRLFRDISESHTEKELLIFITPTLVDNSTDTRVSEEMKHNLHQITRDQSQMPTIPKITDSTTIIAQDDYTEEDQELADKLDKKQSEIQRKNAKKAAERAARLAQQQRIQSVVTTPSTAAYSSSTVPSSTPTVRPVNISNYYNKAPQAQQAMTWQEKMAALHQANMEALHDNE